jgi:hypothetical protein
MHAAVRRIIGGNPHLFSNGRAWKGDGTENWSAHPVQNVLVVAEESGV